MGPPRDCSEFYYLSGFLLCAEALIVLSRPSNSPGYPERLAVDIREGGFNIWNCCAASYIALVSDALANGGLDWPTSKSDKLRLACPVYKVYKGPARGCHILGTRQQRRGKRSDSTQCMRASSRELALLARASATAARPLPTARVTRSRSSRERE